ncbi:MAG: tetratricopeptide repeat protein [Deltaproteobacteria bacterium]|nr:tetratricopeptide repeat protein [Deltaproteobacteria bacterium]
MKKYANNYGRVRAGLIIFIVLLSALAGKLIYQYADKASRLVNQAKELMNQEKFDGALKILDEALLADPEHIHSHYHRGICLAERHRWDEAIAAFDRTIELDNQEANAYFNKGKIYWHLKQYDDAVKAFDLAIEHQGHLEEINRKTVWMLLGECFYETHLDKLANSPDQATPPSRAIAAYKTYIKERPGAPDRKAIEQRIEILSDPEKFKEIVAKRKKGTKTRLEDLLPAKR